MPITIDQILAELNFTNVTDAETRLTEANDYLNSLSPDNPPVTIEKRLAGLWRRWASQTLVQKQAAQDQLDQTAVRDAVNSDLDIGGGG